VNILFINSYSYIRTHEFPDLVRTEPLSCWPISPRAAFSNSPNVY